MELPEGFLSQFENMGVDALTHLADGLSEPSAVSVRINVGKAPGLVFDDEVGRVDWCESGRYLGSRPSFTFDPALHQGLYYVQDASSMFIAHVIRHLTDGAAAVRYLDACAAPGGKTTAAIDALPRGAIVVANEYVASRAAVLRENLTKWGEPGCVVAQGDTSRFASVGAVFDIIAADVPCSGEGMMRKDPQAVAQWSPELVRQCAARQREIVTNLWAALRPGGYLIYSTCTFNVDENEQMLRFMREQFGAESVEIPVEESWGIVPAICGDMPAYRFIPGAVRGEGLFMGVVRKPLDAEVDAPGAKKKKEKTGRKPAAKMPDIVKNWLLPEADVRFSVDEDGVIRASVATAWPNFPFTPFFEVATLKGRDVVPSHALAMSRLLNAEAFPQVDVDRDRAIAYLRCDAIALPPDTPRGFVLLTYGGHPLGFVKNIGNRSNNLYPRAWRILSQNR